jgi:hypothetical protein
MQFIEVNSLGVRSAVYRLARDGSHTQFLLFPMIHVAAPTFYKAVEQRLAACDVVLLEGVAARATQQLSHAYGLAGRIRGSGLVPQTSLNLAPLQDRLVASDVSAETFEAGWRTVPLRERLTLLVGVPLVTVAMAFTGPRRYLATLLEQQDLPSRDEVLLAGTRAGDHTLLDTRDAQLVRQLEAQTALPAETDRLVGVLWGAAHMRAATRALARLGYRVVQADWLTVFDL